MVDLQMSFPPGEKGFHGPPQGEDQGDLLGGQVLSIGSNPIGFTSAFEAYQAYGMCHLVAFIAQQDKGEEEDRRSFGQRELFYQVPLGVLFDTRDEVLVLFNPVIEPLMILVSPI